MGPALTSHSFFPEGTNVELVAVDGLDELRIWIWERGVGRTESSGTGACAAAVAAASYGGASRDVTVSAPGGSQRVEWKNEGVYLTAAKQKIALLLPPNPSHLESIYPVVEGQVKAFQSFYSEAAEKNLSLPILIHGDASIAGQGVIYETLQFSHLKGYKTGGTIHFIINNEVGFTTAPKEARSTLYCSDIAKSFNAPVLHVNAEDVEGAIRATFMALFIRQKFQQDVFIDLNCYRKYGHNEGDEPAFTQPLLYQIKKRVYLFSLSSHAARKATTKPGKSRKNNKRF